MKHFILDECDRLLAELDMRRDVQTIFMATPHEKQVKPVDPSSTSFPLLLHSFPSRSINHIVAVHNYSPLASCYCLGPNR